VIAGQRLEQRRDLEEQRGVGVAAENSLSRAPDSRGEQASITQQVRMRDAGV
jgi:hypothetical protein